MAQSNERLVVARIPMKGAQTESELQMRQGCTVPPGELGYCGHEDASDVVD